MVIVSKIEIESAVDSRQRVLNTKPTEAAVTSKVRLSSMATG